jgi:patatin-like phospholipase/acyl hydrolase
MSNVSGTAAAHRTYRILSLDGGGIRGVLPARLIEIIAQRYPNLLASVDLIAGTSAGAINAVALTFPVAKSPAELVGLYVNEGRTIFHASALDRLASGWGLIGSKYGTSGRQGVLVDALGPGSESTTLAQLTKRVVLCTFQLDSRNPISPSPDPRDWKAKFFHNFPFDNGGVPNADLGVSAIDVALMSSAAPVYFPIFEGFVDGGVVANNPTMCAIAQALNHDEFVGDPNDVVNVADLRVLSIGTGAGKRHFLTEENNSWGLSEWGFKLVDLLVDSVTGVADYQARQLLDSSHYWRLNPALDDDIGLDDVDAVPRLLQIADDWAKSPDCAAIVTWLAAVGW